MRVDREKSALLLIDIQPDFMPGGALPVSEGDRILDPVIRLIQSDLFFRILATQDWHPTGHISFASSHPGRQPFETIELYGRTQTLWPDHCVQGTAGAELDHRLPSRAISAIVRKGMDISCDSYSGFRNNWNAQGERPPTGLAGCLKELGITDVFLCGLARDYCVKWSAEDAAEAGFRTWFLWELTRPVNPISDPSIRRDLRARGVRIISADQLE
jgi:nicotinamidase/pyrazinamidase